jgi:hypothetical protein
MVDQALAQQSLNNYCGHPQLCPQLGQRLVPDEAFTSLRPQQILPAQTVREEVAFLRFKRAMFANDVRAAVENEPDQTKVPPLEVIEAMIARGPGLSPPNSAKYA